MSNNQDKNENEGKNSKWYSTFLTWTLVVASITLIIALIALIIKLEAERSASWEAHQEAARQLATCESKLADSHGLIGKARELLREQDAIQVFTGLILDRFEEKHPGMLDVVLEEVVAEVEACRIADPQQTDNACGQMSFPGELQEIAPGMFGTMQLLELDAEGNVVKQHDATDELKKTFDEIPRPENVAPAREE